MKAFDLEDLGMAYRNMSITLDLADGAKMNYGKLEDLLDGVKLVTGGSGDE